MAKLKCSKCGEKIEQLFLNKFKGTYLRDGKKLTPICSNCQIKQAKSIKTKSQTI